MPDSKTSRLARLRARATGESHSAAAQALQPFSATDPLGLEPTPAQEQLEGEILEKMNGLRITTVPSGFPGQPFGIHRVIPAPNQLFVELERESGFDEFVLNVMPVINTADDSDHGVHGVPGLRVRPHDKGLSLFRPGLDGEVILAGISTRKWEAAHEAAFDSPHKDIRCAATSNPTEWTNAERGVDAWISGRFGVRALQRDREDNILRSALFRRIGFLNSLNLRSANTWAIGGGGVAAELFRTEHQTGSHDPLIDDMTSRLFSPAFTCVSRISGRPLLFTTPRSRGVLEIRIVNGGKPAERA